MHNLDGTFTKNSLKILCCREIHISGETMALVFLSRRLHLVTVTHETSPNSTAPNSPSNRRSSTLAS